MWWGGGSERDKGGGMGRERKKGGGEQRESILGQVKKRIARR
jgi:hypothetical protein